LNPDRPHDRRRDDDDSGDIPQFRKYYESAGRASRLKFKSLPLLNIFVAAWQLQDILR
jgi:hypothetical protein